MAAYKVSLAFCALVFILVVLIVILVSLLDAKIWTFLGLIPFLPIVVTILEDIAIFLIISKKTFPDATVAAQLTGFAVLITAWFTGKVI